MSMGIGWPNASAQTGGLVKFEISVFCSGTGYVAGCSNLVDSSIYNTGDYVFCDTLGIRVLLGGVVGEGEECFITYNISGPVYNSCEI